MLRLAGVTGAAGAFAAAHVARAEAPAPPAVGFADLRSFGAKADGQTDDAAALKAAAASGRAILIEGTVRIDQVVDLPPNLTLIGLGVYRSTLMIGPSGRLRISGPSFDRPAGGTVLRDLTVAPPDRASAGPALEMRHVRHALFDNVTFYRCSLLLDDHHYVAFRDCRFFGDFTDTQDHNAVTLTCDSQPPGSASISEAPSFSNCFFTHCPVLLQDTVDARFTDCAFIGGSRGISSRPRLSRGTDIEPFFMGPWVGGCVLDSLDGYAIDIERGGTTCRIAHNFISVGRGLGTPGVRLVGSSGVDLVGNRFEWCETGGIELDACERIGLLANSFANMGRGPGILARASRDIRVVGNAFENRARWGGSDKGETSLAIAGDQSCTGWMVTANIANGLRDPRVALLGAGIVRDNPGWPLATEQGWPAGPTDARPSGVADGFRWYDQTLGLWLHWHRGSGRWRDAAGRPV